MNESEPARTVWQVLEAQADDMFALYQLAQLLAEARNLDELIHLAVPQMARVCDSPYVALFLPLGPAPLLDLVAWFGPDFELDGKQTLSVQCADRPAVDAWFHAACGLQAHGCLCVSLDVGGAQPGMLLLAAPSQEGFSRHQQHLLATMSREVARMLHLALASADLQRQRQQMEQMQADFVATVSHELRTPLAQIQGYVDSLQYLPLGQDQQERFVRAIGESTAHLTRMVETILTFSRVERQPPLQLREVDLVDLVAAAASGLSPALQARLTIDVPRIALLADGDALIQVVANLLSNALRYSPPDSMVRVRGGIRYDRHTIWLAVRDGGRGVPSEDRPYLFSKFFRARNVRESALTGTGLGLYICKRLVEAHGGSIRLRSRPGSGTVATIDLPRAMLADH